MASGCDSCINPLTPITTSIPGGCPGCGSGCDDSTCLQVIDTACVAYTGPNLVCIGTTTNLCLETILQKIDAILCTPGESNYTPFNLSCLRDSYTINTAQNFAEAISDFVCNLSTDFTTFTTVTYPADIASLQSQIDAINDPSITSPCAGLPITPADDLTSILNKLAGGICNIYSLIDPSLANWDQCFTLIGIPPATITEGFNKVIDYICTLQASIDSGNLPTFDNTGTCLSTPTSNDSLVDTISKIITRLCSTPTFLASNLTPSTCIQFSGASTLEDVIDAQNNQIDQISTTSIRQADPAYFTLVPIDNLQPCLGQMLTLTGNIQDRFVAITASDTTPGTLQDKIVAGANISLDFGIINPNQLTISATGGAATDELVKVNSLDPTAGFLADKLIGSSSSTIVVDAVPIGNTQIQISADIDVASLIPQIIDEINNDPDLKALFCSLVSSCPSPCDAPTNVSVEYVAP